MAGNEWLNWECVVSFCLLACVTPCQPWPHFKHWAFLVNMAIGRGERKLSKRYFWMIRPYISPYANRNIKHNGVKWMRIYLQDRGRLWSRIKRSANEWPVISRRDNSSTYKLAGVSHGDFAGWMCILYDRRKLLRTYVLLQICLYTVCVAAFKA